MILRNVNTGGVEVYDINNNQITGANFMGTVGLDWQFSGVGNFSGRGTSDMLLRNANTGGLEVYDINNNADHQRRLHRHGRARLAVLGRRQFQRRSPARPISCCATSRPAGLEVYDINNNQLTGAAFIGTVGFDWQFAGIAPIHAAGASDLVLRNVKTGAFEVYDIANNQITGAASLGSGRLGLAARRLRRRSADRLEAHASDGSTAQLVQAMAGFGGSGGAADGLNTGLARCRHVAAAVA